MTFRFKTNINCEGCIRRVRPFLDELPGNVKWAVDTAHPDKILTIEGEQAQIQNAERAVRQAGFDIHPLKEAEGE